MNAKHKDIWECVLTKYSFKKIIVSEKCKQANFALLQDPLSLNKYFEQTCKEQIRYLQFYVYKHNIQSIKSSNRKLLSLYERNHAPGCVNNLKTSVFF